ncbi:putative membrane protein (DUF2177) [Paramecium bursaria Chlorella virus NW665.2]|nr:putative membrane protein (DUF2177) [Paramecium bursaria Chlorella virus NW665.2]
MNSSVLKSSAIMLTLDFLWIWLVAGKMFAKMTENIQQNKMTVKPTGALVAYVALILLFNTFIHKETPDIKAFLLGALVYAVYDGTNFALFEKWDAKTAFIDILWGGTLFYITKKLTFDITLSSS